MDCCDDDDDDDVSIFKANEILCQVTLPPQHSGASLRVGLLLLLLPRSSGFFLFMERIDNGGGSDPLPVVERRLTRTLTTLNGERETQRRREVVERGRFEVTTTIIS